MHMGSDPQDTASRVTPAAAMVSTLVTIMVNRRPLTSNSAPVKMRPKPLQTLRTPTIVVANASPAPTDRERSLAKLITLLPTAPSNPRQANAIQKLTRCSIWLVA